MSSEEFTPSPGQLESTGKLPQHDMLEISDEAEGRILSWGITQEQFDQLAAITRIFRYDGCPEKVARLAKNEFPVVDIEGEKHVIIPNLMDLQGRMDGQCSDIASQLSTQLEFSGWIDSVNNYLDQNKRERIG